MVAHQAPILSMEFFRQEYWSGLPFPPPGDLPHPGIEHASLVSPALQVDSLPLSHLGRSPDGIMTATFSRMSNWGSRRLSNLPKSCSEWLRCPLILQGQKEEESEPAPLGTVSQGYLGRECILASFKKSFRDFLEKAIAPHSSTLAWKIPWMEEPGGLQSTGSWKLETTEWLHFHFSLSCIGEGNGNPLQYSCLENPRDRGAWWTAVYGVAQSRTQLKWLSSSSSSEKITLYILTH